MHLVSERGDLGPSIGSVVLPIPSGISDQNKADWGSNSMTALDIAKAEIARRQFLMVYLMVQKQFHNIWKQ